MSNPKTIKIDEIEYIRKDAIDSERLNNENYNIVRSENAGVFAGYLEEENLSQRWVKMKNARRLWYWDGAASLSQLAVNGVSKPQNCKFSIPTPRQTILGVIEIIPCSISAIKIISEVEEWKA